MEKPPETLDTIRCEVRERVLAARSLERLIVSEEFGLAYEKACPTCKIEVRTFIATTDVDSVKRWIGKQLATRDYGELPLRELRALAQRLGVPFYSRLPKASLLSEISRYEQVKNGIH